MTSDGFYARALPGRFLYTALTLLAIGGAAVAGDRPNILLLFASGQRAGMAGFEGNAQVKTPHLDRLASEAVVFSRCYVPEPQRDPNLASALTGVYPHGHGIAADGMILSPGTDTLTARLKRAGYTCGLVGKWDIGEDKSQAFLALHDFTALCAGDCPWQECDVSVNGQKAKAGTFLTDWMADRAIEFITQPKEKPFLLCVGFRAPHPPLVYPPDTPSLYPPTSMPLPASMAYELVGLPGVLSHTDPVRLFREKTEQQIREARSQYAATITHLDANVGRILKRIEQQGLGQRTIVVFASAVGLALGEHRLYGTGPFFYEELVHVPLVVRYPSLVEKGVTTDHVVSLVDLAPTLLALADQKVPVTMQGRSLMPVMKDPQTRQHADECFLVHEQKGGAIPARGVVSEQYKFIDYVHGGRVLYDLKHDPLELHNAVSDPEYAVVVRVLSIRLKAWQKETHDPRYTGPALGCAVPRFP